MKTLFDADVSTAIIDRIQKITPRSSRQWGQMDVSQMLAHCGNVLDMGMGTIKPKRIFIGRIIGPLFKSNYTNEKPFGQDSPTSDENRVTNSRQFDAEKSRLISLVKKFSEGGEKNTTTHPHPFFGPLKPNEWGIGMYKHLDHHLRQFGG
jgi:hypothetical protein